jgi:hypothetical protein
VADFVVLHQLVDGILRQQKARRQATEKGKLDETEKVEREEAEKVRSETSALFISNRPEMTLHYTQTKIPIAQTNIPLTPVDAVIASLSLPATYGTTSVEQTQKRSRPTSPSLEEAFMLGQPGPSSGLVRSPQPDPTVTSLSNIGMSLDTDKSGFNLVFHCIQPIISIWPSRHVHLREAIYSGTGRRCKLC